MTMIRLAIRTLTVFMIGVKLSTPMTQLSGAAQTLTLHKQDSGGDAGAASVANLPLDPSLRLRLQEDFQHRNYKDAEELLLAEVQRHPQSTRNARLLSVVGGILFLDGKYAESVMAWKKSEAIAPLDDRSRFTLAMAYIHLDRRDLARPELDRLTRAKPGNSLYLYWLARLDYDRRDYSAAIGKLQGVIALDPGMVRAYDILGFCYHYVGKADDAINDFHRANELNRQQAEPSPWPPLDFAVVLIEQNRLDDAEKSLREAIGYGPRFPQARFQLGRVLDRQNREQEAIDEFKRAAELDENYPDPHYQLGRIYRRLGNKQLSEQQIDQFLSLKRKRSADVEPATKCQDPSAER